jgi:hypothetical protein
MNDPGANVAILGPFAESGAEIAPAPFGVGMQGYMLESSSVKASGLQKWMAAAYMTAHDVIVIIGK